MLEDADENGAAQAVRVLNRSASIESASTVRAQLHREHHGEVERINLDHILIPAVAVGPYETY